MRLSLSGLLDRWLAPAPDPRKVAWIGAHEFAHRGLHGPDIPENSQTGFAAAIARDMGIELDVQCSADGAAVVFHDWELDRLTAERGPVSERTATELGAIRLTGGADGIPTLPQVLDLIDGRAPLLIEIKSRAGTPYAPLCEAVSRAIKGRPGDLAIMSFDPRVSRWFARHSPATPRGLVMTEEHDRPILGSLRRHLWLWVARPDFLAYDIRDLPSRFAAAQRARGLALPSWTVRSPELRARATEHADAPIAEGAGVA